MFRSGATVDPLKSTATRRAVPGRPASAAAPGLETVPAYHKRAALKPLARGPAEIGVAATVIGWPWPSVPVLRSPP